jgi:hypothetical protein
MTKGARTARIGAVVAAFACLAFAEPIPPLAPVGRPDKTAAPAPAQPEVQSPCTFDLDAGWLVPLKTVSTTKVRTNVPKPVNCEGAVIKAVTATGKGAITTLQFTVAYKPGRDRVGIISYTVLDDDNRTVGVGEVRDTLAEGADSELTGTLKIKEREFDRVFASGNRPVIRITLRLERE